MPSPRAPRIAADLSRLRGLITAIERGVPPGFPRGAAEGEDGMSSCPEGGPSGAIVHAPADGASAGAAWSPVVQASPRLPFEVPAVDAALGGGLLCGALHEAAGAPGDEGALGAFALGLAARAAARLGRPVLLALQEMAEWEVGRLYGPGLAALGLPPEALLLVRVRKPQDVLFVMEEGLKCSGLSAVLGEFSSPVPEALTATRRLALAARGSDRLGLMLRHKADPSPCAALTRWRVSALPSPAVDGFGGLGAPSFTARLTRNRFGPTGAWPLLFRAGLFRPAPGGEARHEPGGAGAALSQPRAAAPAHGPRRAADVA